MIRARNWGGNPPGGAGGLPRRRLREGGSSAVPVLPMSPVPPPEVSHEPQSRGHGPGRRSPGHPNRAAARAAAAVPLLSGSLARASAGRHMQRGKQQDPTSPRDSRLPLGVRRLGGWRARGRLGVKCGLPAQWPRSGLRMYGGLTFPVVCAAERLRPAPSRAEAPLQLPLKSGTGAGARQPRVCLALGCRPFDSAFWYGNRHPRRPV